jgi:hypothetical protein
MIPGMNPKRVSNMFNQKALPIPTVKNTPSGGRRIAKIILSKLIILTIV